MFSDFYIMLTGTSHKNKSIPCQDYCTTKHIFWHEKEIVLSAVADGLGSCAHSEIGSKSAVISALKYLEKYLTIDPVLDRKTVIIRISEAFNYAHKMSDHIADECGYTPFSLSTTLTVTVFFDNTLCWGHCGDSGVVALDRTGKISMVTKRHKGEEASSVIPLQGGKEHWEFNSVENIAAFALMTDGVLDVYALKNFSDNSIYIPFFTSVFFKELNSESDIYALKKDITEYFDSKEFRSRVNDDISFVNVVDQELIRTMTAPEFDEQLWVKEMQQKYQDCDESIYPGLEHVRRQRNLQKRDDESHSSILPGRDGESSSNRYSNTLSTDIRAQQETEESIRFTNERTKPAYSSQDKYKQQRPPVPYSNYPQHQQYTHQYPQDVYRQPYQPQQIQYTTPPVLATQNTDMPQQNPKSKKKRDSGNTWRRNTRSNWKGTASVWRSTASVREKVVQLS